MFHDPFRSIAAFAFSKSSVSWPAVQVVTAFGMEPSFAISANTFRAAMAGAELMSEVASVPALLHKKGANVHSPSLGLAIDVTKP